jgi:hypothetical protein
MVQRMKTLTISDTENMILAISDPGDHPGGGSKTEDSILRQQAS